MTRPEFAQNLIQARLSRGLGVESAFPFLLPGRRSILDRVIFAAPDNCASLSLHCGLLISDRRAGGIAWIVCALMISVMSSAVKRTYFPIRRKGMAFLRVRS